MRRSALLLAIGLASGVGLWVLAVFATAFVLAVLWIVESFEPKAMEIFTLKIAAKDPAQLKGKVEQLLARSHAPFELRMASKEELQYEVRWPADRRTDRISEAMLKLDPDGEIAVDWEEKKGKK
jgi:uncharacterized membrane protein YhiD involved in acid resistance